MSVPWIPSESPGRAVVSRVARTPSATPSACCGTAGFVSSRTEGRVVYYRLAEGFPEPLRRHCVPQLIELSRQPAADA